jgi:putative heme-binding domain-containing protein
VAADKEEVTLPNSAADIERGKKLYDGSCQLCHGPRGDGGKGANLAQAKLPRAGTDGDLARVIEVGIPGTEMPGAWHMTRREVTQVAAYVKTLAKISAERLPGNAAAGEEVYAANGCSSCHTVASSDGVRSGGFMGPDLSNIGARRSAAHLRESILDPAKSVPEDFVDTTVELRNGRKITGKRLNEDTFLIIINDYSGNNHVVSKEATRQVTRHRDRSPMPSYAGKIAGPALDDLIAYLASLRETR